MSRGPMEVLDRARVTPDMGLEGDCRGRVPEGKRGNRQITVIEAESWAAAMNELGGADGLVWSDRRANLLVSGVRLPRVRGRVIAIGNSLRIEVRCECDPCSRMDALRDGLRGALTPDWRGGICGRVISEGEIAVGDEVRIEE
ncbi:MOSC domain-containing protein [Novosphingobium sp. PASSN1]|uniref:MOSC domain-containing protein n=1 Tax=Novosphingobium sp. PASSN1 TaxID=2015561 RepID=UPI003455A6BF